MWKLIIEDDEGKRTIVPLTRESYSLGRKEGNSIRLTERNVSREHAKLRKKNGAGADAEKPTFTLEDHQSYNGVYVNGLRVSTEQELAHGDLIQIGDYRIVLQDESVADLPASQVSADLKATIPGTASARATALLDKPNRLVMLAGPTPGAEFTLDAERVMSIGRAEDATISINHNSVSRLHCEVHPLGDGRFEIVDKGSSNGVRVNAADLRRGIVEANDVIELGDVKFKFIGAGQIFRPGATESQQLSAIGDRTASSLVKPRRGGALPAIVFGAIVAAGGVTAYFVTRPHPQPYAAPAASADPGVADPGTVVAEAKRLCDQGEVDACYEKVANELPEASPAREWPDVRGIAAVWADKQLERAVSDPDLTRRRTLLRTVSASPLVDGERRKQAQEKLTALEEFERGAPSVPEAPEPLAIPEAGAAAPVPRKPPRPPAAQAPSAGAPAAPAVSAAPKPQSDLDKVRALLLQTPPAYEQARAVLERKVFANKASPAEIDALKTICKAQGDKACVEHCKQLLAPAAASAPAPTP